MEYRLIIGVVTIFLIIVVLLALSIRKRKKAIPKNQEIFGYVFFRNIIMLFPAIIITSKDIYEFLVIITCLIFASILNTQYFIKMSEQVKDNKQ